MDMKNYFLFNVQINNFIFKGIQISSWQGLLITCLITSMLAFSLSTITFVKEMVHQSISAHQKSNAFLTEGKIVQVWTTPLKMHVFQTATSLVQITLGYFIMLIIMSFNGYLFLSAVIGSTIGYFCLNPWLLRKQSLLNLHISQRLVLQNQADDCGSLMEDTN